MNCIEDRLSHGLSQLCRVCLLKTDIMLDPFDLSKDLYDLCKIVFNIEFERNGIFPNFLCSICKEKIVMCQELINQCKRTNELLEKYRIGIKIEEEDTKILLDSENIERNDYVVYCDSNDGKDYKEEFNEMQITSFTPEVENQNELSHNSKDSKENFNYSIDNNVQKLQLKQFSYEEVVRAVEIVRNKSNDFRNCVECNYFARNFRSLSLHMSYMHKDAKDSWCPTCNGIFENLEEHAKTHDKSENSCQFCGRGFAERRVLVEHLYTHSKTRPHKCNLCNKSFIHLKNLRKHSISHREEKPFVCNLCGITFTQRYSLKTHMERFHKDETEFRCINCQFKFENEEMFSVHQCNDIVTNTFVEKQNFCNICNRNIRSLTLHNRKFHEGRKINEDPVINLCTICGKQIKSYAKFEAHMRIHTGETPYKCRYCDKRTTRRYLLVLHERTHTGERPYICRICKKDFTQRSSLNTHMKLHSSKQDKCLICGKEFYRIADLRSHLKKHTGEKPFVCSVCGKGFILKGHLTAHVRTHKNDDRLFKCDRCPKSFRQRSALKSHSNVHLGEKPFVCSVCGKGFVLKCHLAVHVRSHTDDRPFKCDRCQKSFRQRAAFKAHVQKHLGKSRTSAVGVQELVDEHSF